MFERRKQEKSAIDILDKELMQIGSSDPLELSAVQLMRSYFKNRRARRALRSCINPGVRLWARKKMMLLASQPIALKSLADWMGLL